MSRNLRYERPELRDRLAAEYVLGTLRGAARRRFERLLARDAAIQDAVAVWRRRIDPLGGMLPAQAPPASVWRGIERRIAPARVRGPWRDLWDNLAFWRGLGLAASALALTLTLLPLLPLLPGPDMPEKVAVVMDETSKASWVITGTSGHRMLVRALEPPPMPEGKVCVLWLVWDDGKQMPLGMLPEKGEMKMPMPPMDREPYRAQVFVSVEAMQDMPMEKPAGPMVYKGPWLSI